MKYVYYHIKPSNWKYRSLLFITLSLQSMVLITSCEDFVEIDPPRTELVRETVFTNDNTALAAINGIYSEMIDINAGLASGSSSSVTYLCGLSADELDYFGSSTELMEFNVNSLLPINANIANSLWGRAYTIILYTNSVLEGLANSTEVTPLIKMQLEGEAKFIRAFFHFYLVNLFGDAPLVTNSSFESNNTASRTTEAQIYEQIIDDLKDAQNLLEEDYPSGERVRPNKAVATALLARTYLFVEDWAKAELEATKLIENSNYRLSADLNSVFIANSEEAIWQLRPIQPFFNTAEGANFVLTSSPFASFGNVALTDQLRTAFEAGDNRKTNWVDSFTDDGITIWYYAHKYKIQFNQEVTEYSVVMRLAEQYLIRAEARVQQNNITGAQFDLNAIRNRAGLANTSANNQLSLLAAIEHERRVELFTEWGHRWFDLKRTERADAVLSSVKADWQATDILYPVPQSEREINPNLTQNPGY